MPPKRRRRFHGLYSHSSKPKVLPMNDQSASSNERRMRGNDDLSVKLSTIRIWMHEKDIGKLTRVLWAGQGNRLRQQASTNGKVKRFLAAVPYVMNSIKDVHQAVIDNNLENLQSNLEPPVPPSLVTCRDANGLNLIHKAAGLGHATILEYLITTWPDGVHETDITGKTPLHWAASAKNNMRCYTLLTQAGCDEEAVDYKMKTPSFYRHKPHEIERTFLMYIPEAPRVSPHVATDWEALSDDSGDGKKLDIKIPEMNGFGRHSNAESNENASETEMAEAASAHEDEAQSVAENTKPVDDQDQTNEKTVEDETEIKSEDGHKEEQTNEKTEENAEDGEQQKTEEPNEDEEMQNKEENEEQQDEKQQTETLTETTAILTKDSEDKDKIENKKHAKEIEYDNENETTKGATDDLIIKDESQEIIQKEEEKASHTKQEVVEDIIEKHNDTNEANLVIQKDHEQTKEPFNKITIEEENKHSLDEILTEERNEGNEIENEKSSDGKKETENQNKPDSEVQAIQENKTNGQTNILEDQDSETEKAENEEQSSSKTLGETLTDIKDEVKDNITYLAKQIKNAFSDKDDGEEKDNNSTKTNDSDNVSQSDDKVILSNEEETKENEQEAFITNEANKDNLTENTKTLLDKQQNLVPQESKVIVSENEQNAQEINTDKQTREIDDDTVKQNNKINNENMQNLMSADFAKEGPDELNKKVEPQISKNIDDAITTSSQNVNSSNESTPSKIKIPSPSIPKTPAKASPKNENDKTEEDENNNESKSIASTIHMIKTSQAEAITDEQFKELDKSLEEYKKAEENSLQEKEKDMGVKLDEMADNLKENVKEIADKVVNVLLPTSVTKDKFEKFETESNDVVIHAESSQKQLSRKKSTKDDESSDDTADEDEVQFGTL